MKSILCPTDFSEVASNAIEYAAQLTKSLSASITLTYVRPTIWPEAVQLEQEERTSAEEISALLKRMCQEVQNEFGVICNFNVQSTTDTLEETIAALASQYDLLVMGTNGADNYYQYVFGSNTYHVIEKTKCSVIVVPRGCKFKQPDILVYAYDPDTNPVFLIDELKKLVSPLRTEVHVLHIAERKPSDEEDHKMEIMRDAIKARMPKNIGWAFEFQYSDDVPWALDHYMKTHQMEMLALSFHHRSLMERLFSKNVIKEITMISEYPVFVFWH